MIGDAPEFEDGTSDELFEGLLDAGFSDLVGIGSCVGWRMVVLESRHVDVLAVVRMFSPANIHSLGVRVVEFVVRLDRPLNVDPGRVGATEAIVERHFENGWVEVVVQYWRGEWLVSVNDVPNREECRTVDRSS